MKVLVSAYACEPGRGSEPEAGWVWATAAARNHDVWVITTTARRPAIEQALEREPDLSLHPVYVDFASWARRWQRGRRGIHLYYVLWQRRAARVARRLHAEHEMDLVHHLTYAMDWMPASVGSGIPRPFIWGPVGGSTGMDWKLWRWVGPRGLVIEAVRSVVTRMLRPLLAGPAARRADLILAQNADTRRSFRWHPNVRIEPNARVDLPNVASSRPPGDRRRAAFVGRLVALKGLRLGIQALTEPAALAWELHVYGDGPEEEACRSIATRLGLDDRVTFHGLVPRDELLAEMAGMDALLFPSIHDQAPFAVAEATALGVPTVCLDRGGPVVLMGPGSVAVPTDGDVVGRLADALGGLTSERVPSDRWAAAAIPALVDELYREVAAGARTGSPHQRDAA